MTDDLGYSSRRTCAAVGITYRQLDYWARTDLIRPSIASGVRGERGFGQGPRPDRRYSFSDILRLAIVSELLGAGMRLDRIRDFINDVEVSGDLTGRILVIDGGIDARILPGVVFHKMLQQARGMFTVVPLTAVQNAVNQRLEAS